MMGLLSGLGRRRPAVAVGPMSAETRGESAPGTPAFTLKDDALPLAPEVLPVQRKSLLGGLISYNPAMSGSDRLQAFGATLRQLGGERGALDSYMSGVAARDEKAELKAERVAERRRKEAERASRNEAFKASIGPDGRFDMQKFLAAGGDADVGDLVAVEKANEPRYLRGPDGYYDPEADDPNAPVVAFREDETDALRDQLILQQIEAMRALTGQRQASTAKTGVATDRLRRTPIGGSGRKAASPIEAELRRRGLIK